MQIKCHGRLGQRKPNTLARGELLTLSRPRRYGDFAPDELEEEPSTNAVAMGYEEKLVSRVGLEPTTR